MELINQFQGVLGSLLLGGLFSFIFVLIKSVLNHRGLKFLFFLGQILFFSLSTYLYYLFMCYFTYGIYNFFFTISLFIGIGIYFFCYHPYLEKYLKKIEVKIEDGLKKYQLKLKKIFTLKKKKGSKKRKNNKQKHKSS